MWFWIVLGIILGIALIISLVLAVPVDAILDLDVHRRAAFRARVKWLFGLVSFDSSVERKAVEKKPEAPRPKKPRRKAGFAEGWRQFELVLDILQIPGLFNEVKKFLIRLYRCFDLKKLDGDFGAGLPDPADTGFFYGIYSAITIPTGFPLADRIRIHPRFTETIFEGQAQAVVRLRPIYLIAPVGLFLFSPPVLKALWMLVRLQWRKKRSPQVSRYQLAA